mgnify:CR=1 FL=1
MSVVFLSCAGDVLLHTVTDAILGALSLPDIGAYILLRLSCSLCNPRRWLFGGQWISTWGLVHGAGEGLGFQLHPLMQPR